MFLFLDKLKSFCEKIEIKNALNFFSGNKTTNNHYHIHLGEKKGVISFNPNKIPEEYQEELKNIVKEGYNDSGYLLDCKQINLIENVQEAQKVTNSYEALYGIIPKDDVYALKASIVIKNMADKKIPIEEHKINLVNNFGERGRKICNLYSAGYFEELLSLFHEVSKEDFLKNYHITINEYAFAVFVNIHIPKDRIITAIKDKLERNKNYGIYYVNVHAIGKINVDNTISAINKILDSYTSIEEETRDKKKNILFVRLIDASSNDQSS
ncbi:MAG: hypothetical protein L6420_03230 [Elusimicrobia bacterium]|nr:hypothetical protein [Elusimicrobiota bacterium]